jgi:hypothetical protein
MTTATPLIDPHADPAEIDPELLAQQFPRVVPSTLNRGQLVKACNMRPGLETSVSDTNVQLIEKLTAWQNDYLPAVEDDEDEDDGDGFDLDNELMPAVVEAARQPVDTPIRASHADRDPAPTPIDALAARDAAPKPPAAGANSASAPAAGQDRPAARPKRRTGEFPGGYRAEFQVGYRGIDDNLHRTLIEETHHKAWEAGYRTKGAPYAGLRIAFHGQGDRRTVVYEVAINRNITE